MKLGSIRLSPSACGSKVGGPGGSVDPVVVGGGDVGVGCAEDVDDVDDVGSGGEDSVVCAVDEAPLDGVPDAGSVDAPSPPQLTSRSPTNATLTIAFLMAGPFDWLVAAT
jgi:hypothetical protein